MVSYSFRDKRMRLKTHAYGSLTNTNTCTREGILILLFMKEMILERLWNKVENF